MASLTCPVVTDFARPHHVYCTFQHSVCQPSVVVRFLSQYPQKLLVIEHSVIFLPTCVPPIYEKKLSFFRHNFIPLCRSCLFDAIRPRELLCNSCQSISSSRHFWSRSTLKSTIFPMNEDLYNYHWTVWTVRSCLWLVTVRKRFWAFWKAKTYVRRRKKESAMI